MQHKSCPADQWSCCLLRADGTPLLQGMMVAEVVMDHLARAVGKSSAAMRELNLYKEGDTTHFGQTLDGCQVCPGTCPASCCYSPKAFAAHSLHSLLGLTLHSNGKLSDLVLEGFSTIWYC